MAMVRYCANQPTDAPVDFITTRSDIGTATLEMYLFRD